MVFYKEILNFHRYQGWPIILVLVTGYAILYILNLLLPLEISFPFQYPNLTSRIWSWTELLLGVMAILVIILNRSLFASDAFIRGSVLGVISGTSHYGMNQSLTDGLLTGILVLLCYTSALTMYHSGNRWHIFSFQESHEKIARLILYGIIISIPFACINLAYFYLNNGLQLSPGMVNAAILACNPAISEEIIFRFFPVILTLGLLRKMTSDRLAMAAAICVGVIPHSLNHLPDLFLIDPVGAMIMGIMTSLLFGLPMCLLQFYKGLPSACGFHWFVDMTRFMFGY
jgi:hypothetical protein